MPKSCKSVFAFMIALLLFAVPATALAEPPSNSTQIVDGQVDWVLSPGQCADVPGGLAGSGQRHQVIVTKTNPDGSVVTTINDVVKGDAWDAAGTYNFVYTNHSTDVLAADGTHSISMADIFVVSGRGAEKMNVGFNWRWTYSTEQWPPGPDVQKISTRGDPYTCDPI